jgi:multiple sugar transport system permease protein
MIPLFIIVRSLGLSNSLWGIILPMIPHAYGIFLFRQFYMGIPRELEESAMMDGLSHYRGRRGPSERSAAQDA